MCFLVSGLKPSLSMFFWLLVENLFSMEKIGVGPKNKRKHIVKTKKQKLLSKPHSFCFFGVILFFVFFNLGVSFFL